MVLWYNYKDVYTTQGDIFMDKLKTKVQNADWWEIGYLVIYGAIFIYSFLNTTMFEVNWPPRFGYIFLASSALYTIAKFIWHNSYSKKEMIMSAIILIAFIVPAIVTDYSFLFWIGFMIVGAKGVDFNKILKVYIFLGTVLLLAAIIASQVGWIENLVYVVWRNEQITYRNSFGIVYPTDFAAHVFYLLIAGVCLSEDKLTWGKIINFLIPIWFLMDKCDAKTSCICMVLMASMLMCVYLFKNKIKSNWFYHLLNMIPIGLAGLFLALSHIYDSSNQLMVRLNQLLSERLMHSNNAVTLYDYKLFGQNVEEVPYGGTIIQSYGYFFIDDSYLRIAILYGVVLLLVVLAIFWLCGVKAIKYKKIIILVALVAIGVHSFMEHHLIEVAYNPLLCYLFANERKV